jgi:hypothetical protein
MDGVVHVSLALFGKIDEFIKIPKIFTPIYDKLLKALVEKLTALHSHPGI